MTYAPGDVITLLASAARTDATTPAYGTAVDLLTGAWLPRSICCVLSCTAHATDAGDTLDVYIDVSPDNSTWVNAAHFTQIAGNASPAGGAKEWVWLGTDGTPGTAGIAISSDASSGAVRPYAIMRYIRARFAIADASTDNASHTFGVKAYVY